MRFVCYDRTFWQPSTSIPSCYPLCLLLLVFTPSFLLVPHSLRAAAAAERMLLLLLVVVTFTKQLLFSYFPHPAPITVIISTVNHKSPSTSQSHCPTLVLIRRTSFSLRWRGVEGDSGRNRKLLYISTGKKSSKRGGCYSLLVFFWETQSLHKTDDLCWRGLSIKLNS